MARHLLLLITVLQAATLTMVHSAKQQLMLSDSYLPVAMQVIAHLTDQMAFDIQADEPVKPSTKPPSKPSTPIKPSKPATTPVKPSKPADTPVKPNKPAQNIPSWVQNKPTTKKPMYVMASPYSGGFQRTNNGWGMSYGIVRLAQTTPFHRPGLYAPVAPPKPGHFTKEFLLPLDHNSQYTVIEPLEKRTEDTLLSIENTEIKPLVEPKPEKEHLLPPHFDGISSRTSEDILLDDQELSDENLQYLSPNVREMIKMAYDPDDEQLVDVLGDLRVGAGTPSSKAKLSSTNLRLLLLYDLLSREAKKQRLNDYSGFSEAVMRELVESSRGGARAQLSFALSRMLDRRDCDHEYANNRAKEMIAELAKDESPMSAEIGYLQPLVYKMFS